jgi:hypothetical protein
LRIAIAGMVVLLAAALGLARWLYRHRVQQACIRTAQLNVRIALTAEQHFWANNRHFSPASDLGSVLPRVAPCADYPARPKAMIPGTVYVSVFDSDHVELSAVAETKLYTIVQSNEAGNPSTRYGVTALSAGRPDPAKITGNYLSW